MNNAETTASNKGAYARDFMGNIIFDESGNAIKTREFYHNENDADTINIFASKTRLIEIYNNLANGRELDGHGYIKRGK